MSQRFGPYQVGETIGRGTFAKVKVAVHEATHTKVALKIIPRKVMEQDARSNIKITREINILRVLRHPNIMRLYDVVQTKHDIVLVLEYVSGGELFDCICRKGRLDESTTRHYFQQIVAALAYCHRYRVAHRDIKPENIMMGQGHRNIKIGDFGLSSVMHDGCFFETSCGTPNYASPEVVSGKLYSGPETDVWSCGVVLYTMIAGSLPFDDQNIGSLFKKIQAANYTMPTDVSPMVQDLLRRMLVVNPLDRATMEQVMQHPWVRPTFPPHLLARHYDAIFDCMRPARSALVRDDMVEDVTMHTVAARFHVSAHEVASIVAMHEQRKWSILNAAHGEGARRRYPAEDFFETFSNVVDAKLWPEPLVIHPAEQALRDPQHDILVSYLILQHNKEIQIPLEHIPRMAAHTEAAGSLLMSMSMSQGYGSLNANSLRLFSVPATAAGKSLQQQTQQAQAQSALKGQKEGDLTFFGSLPAHVPMQPDPPRPAPSPAGAAVSRAEPFMDGYNRLVEVSLSLAHPSSRHTLLGGLLGAPELSASSSNPLPKPKAKRAQSRLSIGRSTPRNQSLSSATVTPNATPAHRAGGSHSLRLLKPLADDCGDAMTLSSSLKEPMASSLVTRSGDAARGPAGANRDGDMQLSGATHLPDVLHCEAAPRFGNDFMRNGVLFTLSDSSTTLRYVYMAMKEEGLLWKVIHPYFFAAVMQPSVKLQVNIYKVTTEEYLVDVKVSCQSGMSGYDAATRLLDRLRNKAIALVNKQLRKSFLVGNQSFLGTSGNASFATSAGEAGNVGQRAAARVFPV